MNKLFLAFLAGVFAAILWMGFAIIKDGGARELKYRQILADAGKLNGSFSKEVDRFGEIHERLVKIEAALPRLEKSINDRIDDIGLSFAKAREKENKIFVDLYLREKEKRNKIIEEIQTIKNKKWHR